MYISFHNPYATQDDKASLVTFRRMHLIAAVAEVVIVIIVILGAVPAFHIASVGPLAWRLSPTQSCVANVTLWGVTFAAICLVPLWRYAMLRPTPSLTQEGVLRRLLATSLITFVFSGAPALLACGLFVLNSLRGG